MKGKEKTKEQLMDELVKLRQQITELEHVKIRKITAHHVWKDILINRRK